MGSGRPGALGADVAAWVGVSCAAGAPSGAGGVGCGAAGGGEGSCRRCSSPATVPVQTLGLGLPVARVASATRDRAATAAAVARPPSRRRGARAAEARR